jgi:hypothetical protein
MTMAVETKEEKVKKSEEELERKWAEQLDKEREKSRLREMDLMQLQEAGKEPLVPKELEEEGSIEKIERKPERDLPAVPTDDQGKPLITSTDDQAVEPIILPMTKEEFETGIKEDLWTNLRWLAEWCLYVIKKYGGRVFFRG